MLLGNNYSFKTQFLIWKSRSTVSSHVWTTKQIWTKAGHPLVEIYNYWDSYNLQWLAS